MLVIETGDLGTAYPELLTAIQRDGEPVQLEEEKWYEVRPLVIQLRCPHSCLVAREGFNPSLMWMDIAQVLAGEFDRRLYDKVSPNAAAHLDPRGAYGPRVKHQLLKVRDLLSGRRGTRRGVVYLGAPQDLVGAKPGGMPCTIAWQFIRRGDTLKMVTHLRSNDVVWGLCYDIPTAIAVGEALAADLGVAFTEYTHLSGAGILYEKHCCLVAIPRRKNPLPIMDRTSLENTMFYAMDTLSRLRYERFDPSIPFWTEAMKVWKRRFEGKDQL